MDWFADANLTTEERDGSCFATVGSLHLAT